MPRHLLLSIPPKTGQALALATSAPGLHLDGIADADAVLVVGDDAAVSALLAAHSGRIRSERIAEIPETSHTPTLSNPFSNQDSSQTKTPPEPLEPPLPPSFRFA